jgi:mRNA interferase RelE/StbE
VSPDPRDRRRSRSSTQQAGGAPASAQRITGCHPDAQYTVVRLTDAAVVDLQALRRLDRQILKWALKKMLLLEKDPDAGEPLVGDLIGWRKLTVGDRDWRIVWRVTHDASGSVVVDVAEVWAAGARSDQAVYAEMSSRLASLPTSPHTVALKDALAKLAVVGIRAREEPAEPSEAGAHLPKWLRDSLRERVGLNDAALCDISFEDAVQTWNVWTSRPQ